MLVLLALLLCLAPAADAAPFIWDQDDDGIDDRVETVHLLGFEFSFVNDDSLAPQRIAVTRLAGDLVFGVYVVFDHTPGAADMLSLTLLGMPVLHRFEAAPAVRSIATFAQVQLLDSLPGVERIEALPLIYPEAHEGVAAIAASDPSERVFPTWAGVGGPSGEGVVVAILDTGINDAPEGAYPGHESLIGRVIGGASFVSGDSLLDTPRDGSTNPSDHGDGVTHDHGTHVAGIVLGDGGPSGYARGVAPAARAVDVKVLNDVGVGSGVAEALDWCIHNRARDWGVPGYEGIDVINLSLSSLDESDGNDVASVIARRAAELGIVVIASVGNEGKAHYVPSPAAGDHIIAVGALDHQRTPLPVDDQFAGLSDRGPRADDGDADAADEQKPDLVAPGVAILSADGDLSSDGCQYQRLSGTSMAAAFVSGAVACLRSAYPAMTPDQIAALLRATAWRDLGGLPAGPAGVDPRWQAARGFGEVDLYAAMLEAQQPGTSQLARLELAAATDTTLALTLRTQRERGAAFFAVERAPDAGGAPGAFAAYDSAAAAGDSSLAGAVNRAGYAWTRDVPPAERGVVFWYRAAFTEDGARLVSPARAFAMPGGPRVATVEVTVVHNAYDHDITAAVGVGPASYAARGAPLRASSGGFNYPLPGSSAAVSSEWVSGLSTTGNVSWTFRIDIPAGAVENYLPPSSVNPWTLRVNEGGYLNRSGRVTACRLTWYGPGGTTTYDGARLPMQTLEGGQVAVVMPPGAVDVGREVAVAKLRIGPNPVRSGTPMRFIRAGAGPNTLSVYDLAGHVVARVALSPGAGDGSAAWDTRDVRGRLLPPGVYLARLASGERARIVILPR